MLRWRVLAFGLGLFALWAKIRPDSLLIGSSALCLLYLIGQLSLLLTVISLALVCCRSCIAKQSRLSVSQKHPVQPTVTQPPNLSGANAAALELCSLLNKNQLKTIGQFGPLNALRGKPQRNFYPDICVVCYYCNETIKKKSLNKSMFFWP